jgi:molecular chaperone DnaK
MTEPILVVDFGTSKTAAALVTGGEGRLLREPFSGLESWPTSVVRDGETLLVGTVAERRKVADPGLYSGRFLAMLGGTDKVPLGDRDYLVAEFLAALLERLRAEAQRLAGGSVNRVLFCVREMGPQDPAEPGAQATRARADDPARQVLLAAAETAGCIDVEFLAQPVAVALTAGPHPPGSLVLVCDAGASSTRISVIKTTDGVAETLASRHVDSCGGDHLDELVAAAIRADAESWLGPRLDAAGADGAKARLRFADFACQVKQHLTDAQETVEYVGMLDPPVHLSRTDLERLIGPPLDQLIVGYRELLAEAATAPASLAAVLLTGGCARIPAFAAALTTAAGRPVTPTADPQLACVRGGIGWAAAAPARQIAALGPLPGVRPLAWRFDGGAARLAEWLVPVGGSFQAGDRVARLRDGDDAIWDLTADQPGEMERHCVDAGAVLASGDYLAVIRLAARRPADLVSPPYRVADLPGGQFAAFSPDSRRLLTMDGTSTLRVWEMETAAEVCRLKTSAVLRPRGYDAAALGTGQWLFAHYDGTAIVVSDVATGRQLRRLGWLGSARTVRLSADATSLCACDLGRIRIWDTNGRKLLSVRERLFGGELDSVAFSPDGNWLAVASPTDLSIWDVRKATCRALRGLRQIKDRMWNMTFARDGQRILLAIGSTVEMIDAPSGERAWMAEVPGPVRAADFTPDGSFLATVSHDEQTCFAALWGAADGQLVHRIDLDQPSDNVRISPDGLLMAIGDAKTSTIWALVP